jgi:hypothetical protein
MLLGCHPTSRRWNDDAQTPNLSQPMPGKGTPTKVEVELRKAEIELVKFDRKYDLFDRGISCCTIVVAILACSLPVWVFMSGLRPLAGRTTRVSFSVVLSLTVAVSIVMNIAQFAHGAGRRREIKRLRRRQTDFERRLGVGSGHAGSSDTAPEEEG